MELILEIAIIFFLVIFQSLFGVGLLLFGTPIFLLIGYSFESTLALILPVSIIISLLQIIYHKSSNKNHVFEFNVYCLPFLVFFLIISIYFGNLIDIKIYVSILLILSAFLLINKDKIFKANENLIKYRKLFLIVIGSIHGATNMGGAFLSIFSSLVNGGNRSLTRNYIAYGYFVMGIFQYITIMAFGAGNIELSKLYYVVFPFILFFPSQKLFNKMDDQFFIIIINYTALSFGIIALIMSVF